MRLFFLTLDARRRIRLRGRLGKLFGGMVVYDSFTIGIRALLLAFTILFVIFTKFSGIQSRPLPAQKPHPPIHVGGMSAPALRRAVAQGDGWYGFFQDLDATAAALRNLGEAAKDGCPECARETDS